MREVLLIDGGGLELWWRSCKESCFDHGVVYCLLGPGQLVSDVEKAAEELGNGCSWLWSHLLEADVLGRPLHSRSYLA